MWPVNRQNFPPFPEHHLVFMVRKLQPLSKTPALKIITTFKSHVHYNRIKNIHDFRSTGESTWLVTHEEGPCTSSENSSIFVLYIYGCYCSKLPRVGRPLLSSQASDSSNLTFNAFQFCLHGLNVVGVKTIYFVKQGFDQRQHFNCTISS